jgi:Uma2 family endonuclease
MSHALEATHLWPRGFRPPYSADVLSELPDDGNRYEVLRGNIVVSPSGSIHHQLAGDRLRMLLINQLPPANESLTNLTIRLPSGDGPIPDVIVTSRAATVDDQAYLDAGLVFTAIEVVSPSNARNDRILKDELYAEAGIPCYWRIELRPWGGRLGPVPAVVVGLLDKDRRWKQTTYRAGEEHDIPLAIGPGPKLTTVKLDPAVLVGRRTF